MDVQDSNLQQLHVNLAVSGTSPNISSGFIFFPFSTIVELNNPQNRKGFHKRQVDYSSIYAWSETTCRYVEDEGCGAEPKH